MTLVLTLVNMTVTSLTYLVRLAASINLEESRWTSTARNFVRQYCKIFRSMISLRSKKTSEEPF